LKLKINKQEIVIQLNYYLNLISQNKGIFMSKTKIPQLETSRLILRTIKRKDAKNVFDYAQDQALSKYVF